MPFAIETFVDEARHYCELIETNRFDIHTIRQTLLLLMHGVSNLTIDLMNDECAVEFPHRTYEERRDFLRLADLPFQFYQEIFDPFCFEDQSIVTGDLCDDLADIYGELWHGLQAHAAGETIYAVNHWITSCERHWGRHAISAVTAIDAHIRQDAG